MSAFSAEDFLPAVGNNVELFPWHIHGKDRRRGVADGQAGAVVANPVSILNFNASRGAIPRENGVVIRVSLREIRKMSVISGVGINVVELELLGDIS